MTGLSLLDCIHREGADGIDASPDQLGAGITFTVLELRGVWAHDSTAGALCVQGGLPGKWKGKIIKGRKGRKRRKEREGGRGGTGGKC